jgi:hypothetical protein
MANCPLERGEESSSEALAVGMPTIKVMLEV